MTAFEYIDPDLLLDKYHPVNQPFFKRQQSIQRAVVHQTAMCKPKHVEIAKMHLTGATNVEIAERMDYTAQGIGKVLQREDTRHLLELLRFYNLHLDGPSIEHRKRLLNEIAQDNQDTDPGITIRAVHEMNSMDGVGRDKVDTKVNITINNNQLPKGVLDV